MNKDNLHELINRYESNIDKIYGTEHYELFKWCAVKCWRDEWFKPAGSFSSFAERFTAARREFDIFIDNSRMHPSAGVLKLWEKEPETVEHLFNDVLFLDVNRDVRAAQQQMDLFLEEYELLRQKYFPRNWSYKQDRHSASVFMVMNDPEFHFAYKSSEADTMAKYTEFGLRIGSGGSFSLENYYALCDTIVDALKEHDSLLKKHFSRLSEKCYYDESLHMLAFDLMYCSRTYRFYTGLVAPVTGKTVKKPVNQPLTREQLAEKEAQRRQRIQELETELSELEQQIGDFKDISLIGVEVRAVSGETGTVIAQEVNKVTVQFENQRKTYVLDQKYAARPRFENDEEIVSAFTEYGHTTERIEKIRKELQRMDNDSL